MAGAGDSGMSMYGVIGVGAYGVGPAAGAAGTCPLIAAIAAATPVSICSSKCVVHIARQRAATSGVTSSRWGGGGGGAPAGSGVTLLTAGDGRGTPPGPLLPTLASRPICALGLLAGALLLPEPIHQDRYTSRMYHAARTVGTLACQRPDRRMSFDVASGRLQVKSGSSWLPASSCSQETNSSSLALRRWGRAGSASAFATVAKVGGIRPGPLLSFPLMRERMVCVIASRDTRLLCSIRRCGARRCI